MKALTTLLALTICASSFALPGPGDKEVKKAKSQMDIMTLSNETFKMYYLSADPEKVSKVKVNIYNEEGEKVHSKKVKSDIGFAIPFTLKDLAPGTYTFEVVNPDGTVIRKEIRYNNEIEKATLTEMEAMVEEISPNKFQLLVVKPNENMVRIRIKDPMNNILHEERVNFEKGFKRVYDFQNINADSYTFEVANGPDVKVLKTTEK